MGRLLPVAVIFLVTLSVLPSLGDTGKMSVVSGKTYQVNYVDSGVTIKSIEANPIYDELTMAVSVTSPNAYLQLTIPRALLDSKQGANDIPFIAVVDGTLGNIEETNPTSDTRTITIQLSAENKQVEIIGTTIAMEGSNGGSGQNQVTQIQNTTAQRASNQSAGTQIPVKTPAPPSPTSPQTTEKENASTKIMQNATSNFVFRIPYIPNGVIRLSSIDLAVIFAIVLVVIIVIATSARKHNNKIATRTG